MLESRFFGGQLGLRIGRRAQGGELGRIGLLVALIIGGRERRFDVGAGGRAHRFGIEHLALGDVELGRQRSVEERIQRQALGGFRGDRRERFRGRRGRRFGRVETRDFRGIDAAHVDGKQHVFVSETDDRRAGFGQGIARGLQRHSERGELGQPRFGFGQRIQGLAHGIGGLPDQDHLVGSGHDLRGDHPLQVALERRGHASDGTDLGHREGPVHRVHGAQQALLHALRPLRLRAGQPLVDHFEMAFDFGAQDLEQDRVQGKRDSLRHRFIGRQHRPTARGTDRRLVGRRLGEWRWLGGGHGLHDHGGLDRFDGRGGQFGRGFVGGRSDVMGLLAGGNAVGDGLQPLEIGVALFASQRGAQVGEHARGLGDDVVHRLARRARAIEHTVQHVLDLPAEFAERLGANEATGALQRVEDAADRAQGVDVVELRTPSRQQRGEVVDLLGEFFEEDFLDLGVDILVRSDVVAGQALPHHGTRRGSGGHDDRCRRGGGHLDIRRRGRRSLEPHVRGRGDFDGDDGSGIDRRDRFGDLGGGALRFEGRCRWRRSDGRRQRPIADRREALAGDAEDLVGVRTAIADRLEKVLERCQGIGQAIQLVPARDATLAHEFFGGEARDRREQVDCRGHFEDPEGASHFGQEGRDVLQARVVPVRLDEGDEAGARAAEIVQRFARHDIEHGARFGGRQQRLRGIGIALALAESRHLVVEHGFDVEQRAGDIQQGRFVRGPVATGDGVHGGELVAHHALRYAKTEHPEGLLDAVERVDLRAELRDDARRGAHVQVERVLHAQQVFLDGVGDRGEQGTVVASHRTAGVLDFALARHVAAEGERRVDFAEPAGFFRCMGDEVQQLASELDRRLGAEGGIALGGEALDFALDARDRLLVRALDREGTARRGVEQRGRHPEQPARRFGAGELDHLQADVGEIPRGAGIAVLEPLQQRALEELAGDLGTTLDLVDRHRHPRTTRGRGEFDAKVRREQHRLGYALLAARATQVVEQGQQHQRDVAEAALQAFEVVGQLHDAAHQGTEGVVAILDAAGDQRLGQRVHFLRDHRRAVELDHAQRTVHLGEPVGAQFELGRVLAVLDVVLQALAGQLEGFVDLRLDPGQRGVVVLVLQTHRALSAVRGSRRGGCRGRADQSGSLKSATERRRSAASWARLPIDSAVWLAPCEVCVVIS